MKIVVAQPGQTLESIALGSGLTPELAARYNGLAPPWPLAAGQSLLLLRPRRLHTVRPRETFYQLSARFCVPPLELLRLNPNLGGVPRVAPGQTLVLALEGCPARPAAADGYAYPFVQRSVLRGILPYAGWLTPFTYGLGEEPGTLVPPDDAGLVQLAQAYGVRPLLHLSTLTEDDTFSAARAEAVFRSPGAQEKLAGAVCAQMVRGGYGGVDVDFEYLDGRYAADYAAFLGLLRGRVHAAGGLLMAALAPKTSRTQPGRLYEGHDYRLVGENTDAVLLMTYEWGYAYGPPMAVAPVSSVRKVLDYAVTEIPPEKILLGFPNYAYDWALPFEQGVTRARLLGNEEAPLLAARNGAAIDFDEAAQTPYFRYADDAGVQHEVWFEDPRSCLAKFSLVSEYGLLGVGFWNYMRPFTACFSMLDRLFSIARCAPQIS